MIKKTGGKYQPVSHTGKPLGPKTTKKKAAKRLQQVEYFKHKGR